MPQHAAHFLGYLGLVRMLGFLNACTDEPLLKNRFALDEGDWMERVRSDSRQAYQVPIILEAL